MDISRLAAARGSERRLALWGTCLQVRKWLGSLLSQNELSSDRWLLLRDGTETEVTARWLHFRFGSLNETARAVERCAQGGAWD